MKRSSVISSITIVVLNFAISSCTHSSVDTKSKQREGKVLYQCPMDCESGKMYDRLGKCPVCEMGLVPKVEI